MNILPIRTVTILSCLLLTSAVIADDATQTTQEEVAATVQADGGVEAAFGLNHQFDADIDGGGQFDVTRGYGWLAVPKRLGGDLSVVTRVRAEAANYNFSGAVDPWDTIHQYHLTAVFRFTRSEQWVWFAGPTVRWSGESGADFSDGFTAGGFAGVSYKFSPHVQLGAGLGAVNQISDHALVLPVIRLNWQIADAWSFRLATIDVGNTGIGGALDWQVAEPLRLSFGGFYQNNRFQLDDSGPNRDGVGEETGVALFVNLRWDPCRRFALDTHAGLVVGGELEVEDAPAGANFETDYDPAPFLGVRGVIRL